GVPAVTAAGKHPDPYRTRKLSPPAPMVLHPNGCGRVGHRRNTQPRAPGPSAIFMPRLPMHRCAAGRAVRKTQDAVSPKGWRARLARTVVAVRDDSACLVDWPAVAVVGDFEPA